jgi:glycosyltransferase involved in cell wall biosynthesis
MTPKAKALKIAFVLPSHESHTHFRYVAEFAVMLSRDCDVMLVIERGEAPSGFPSDRVMIQRFRHPVLRFFEMGLMLFRLSINGYRTHYVHYSFVGAFWSALASRTIGGTLYYWNCGMPWLYKRSFLREAFERLVYRMIPHLMTGADALHEGYARYYHIKSECIVTCPNWVDVAGERALSLSVDVAHVRTRHQIQDGAKVLLYVHRLASRKGAHLLPDILRTLARKDVILLIAGDGPERERLTDHFLRHGLMSQVRMLGWVPRESIHELFAIADVYVLPSEEEGFPHVLTEAMAHGVPYVATDVGGVRDMTPPELLRLVVAYGDVVGMCREITALLDDVAMHTDTKQLLSKWVSRYDKTHVYHRFFDLLHSPRN